MNPAELTAAIDRYLEASRPIEKDLALRPLEAKLRRRLVTTWSTQRQAVLATLKAHRSSFDEALRADELDTIADQVRTDATLVATLDVVAASAFDTGVTHVALELALEATFGGTLPEAATYLARWGADRVARIDTVTRDRLRALLVDAANESWSYTQTARAITAQFRGFAGPAAQGYLRNRAELVAMTEIGDAYEYAGRTLAEQLIVEGYTIEKEWLTSSSDVCPICVAGAGDGWRGEDQQFSNGFVGPLAHPGCRCALARRVKPAKPTKKSRS